MTNYFSDTGPVQKDCVWARHPTDKECEELLIKRLIEMMKEVKEDDGYQTKTKGRV